MNAGRETGLVFGTFRTGLFAPLQNGSPQTRTGAFTSFLIFSESLLRVVIILLYITTEGWKRTEGSSSRR